MNENLHHIDRVFKEVHENYEATPSAEVWQKIEAGMDKYDAGKYKKRFVGWRITAILLFFACGFLLWNKYSTPELKKNAVVTVAENNVENSEGVHVKNEQLYNSQPGKNSPEFKGNRETFHIADASKKSAEEKPTGIESNANTKVESEFSKNRNSKTSDRASDIFTEQFIAEKASSPKYKSTTSKKENASMQMQQFADYSASQLNTIKNKQKEKYNKTPASETPAGKLRHAIEGTIQTVTQPGSFIQQPLEVFVSTIPLNRTRKQTNATSPIKLVVKQKPGWLVTAYASNDWNGYRMDNEEHHGRDNDHDKKDDIFKRESHKGSFTLGINLTRQWERWSFTSGLQYAAMKIGIASQKIYASQQSNGEIAYKYVTSSGYCYIDPDFASSPVVGDSLESERASHSLRVLSIPLMVGYKIGNGKFSIMPSAGVAPNYIVGASVKASLKDAGSIEDLSVNRLNGMHHFYLDFIANINLQLKIAEKWSLNLIPSMRYAITPVTKDNVVKTFPYNLGLGAGITYQFK